MNQRTKAETLDHHMRRLERRLPRSMANALHWARQPALIWARVPLACLLMLGGAFSFLPILGIWMAPLGLMLLAQDVSPLQRPVILAFEWGERRWRKWRKRRKERLHRQKHASRVAEP
jgi:hypothetical protein